MCEDKKMKSGLKLSLTLAFAAGIVVPAGSVNAQVCSDVGGGAGTAIVASGNTVTFRCDDGAGGLPDDTVNLGDTGDDTTVNVANVCC